MEDRPQRGQRKDPPGEHLRRPSSGSASAAAAPRSGPKPRQQPSQKAGGGTAAGASSSPAPWSPKPPKPYRASSAAAAATAGWSPVPPPPAALRSPSLPGSSLSQQPLTQHSFHRTKPSLSHFQTTDITKLFAVNRSILLAFERAFAEQRYSTACEYYRILLLVSHAISVSPLCVLTPCLFLPFAPHLLYTVTLGLQFVQTAVLEIPKHGYFYARRHEQERMDSAVNAVRVTSMLQQILLQHPPFSSHRSRIEKLARLARQQVEEASSVARGDAYERKRSETEKELRRADKNNKEDWVVCDNLVSTCGDSISAVFCPPDAPPSDVMNQSLASIDSTAAVRGARREISEPSSAGRAVPSQMSVPVADAIPVFRSATAPARPSASTSSSWELVKDEPISTLSGSSMIGRSTSMDELALEKALYLSGLEAIIPSVPLEASAVSVASSEAVSDAVSGASFGASSAARSSASDKVRQAILQMETLGRLYQEDFYALQQHGRVRISFINTYQGRTPGSTNGCTVIAPLLCMHHLLDNRFPDPGLQDVSIQQVIDEETPAILSELRTQLELSPTAFLIPSDVHDHFIENGQLSQDQFVTVEGGNILDDEHLQKFINKLDRSKRGQLAATLFFNEHVIAVLKLPRDQGRCWYDVIDSLPLKATLLRPDETEHEMAERLGLYDLSSGPDGIDLSDAFVPMAARIRCLDAEALTATLRWYACSKFSDDNVSYINQYDWDDSQSDFDPRVFQAFIWTEGVYMV